MDRKQVEAELAARRKPGSVIERIAGTHGVASFFRRRGVPNEIEEVLRNGFSAAHVLHAVTSLPKHGTLNALGGLSDDDWADVAGILVPAIAPAAASALSSLVRRPYQSGVTRKPFRAPRSRASLADTRGRWLVHLALLVGEYDADIEWVAEWAAHLSAWAGGATLGWLLAGAIDRRDDQAERVFEILKASASGEGESDRMGRHVIHALMSCARPDAWGLVERLLIAAQRQEGLRQVILEGVDEAHPGAFRSMLRLVRDEKLSRFSSVVRAADTWFGFLWDGSSAVKVDDIIDRVLRFLESPADRDAALAESDAETVYLALWALAFDDVETAIEPATRLLSASSPEIRFVAAHLLVQARWASAYRPLAGVLGDEDLRVAARALDAFGGDAASLVDGAQLFQQLEELIGRVPGRSSALRAIVWPWTGRKLETPSIAQAMSVNSSAVPAERFLRHVQELTPFGRADFIRRGAAAPRHGAPPAKPRPLSPNERVVVLDLLGDAASVVRSAAFHALSATPLAADEVTRLVELLDRKAGDLRGACLLRLRSLNDERFFDVADRLLADADDSRRVAGLELLRDAVEQGRAVERARARLARYRVEHPSLSDEEHTQVAAATREHVEVATTDDCLGLLTRPRREWSAPAGVRIEHATRGAAASLASLAALVSQHSRTEIRAANGETRLLVESGGWGFGPGRRREQAKQTDGPPLAEVWRAWLNGRDAGLEDPDGLELVRALVAATDSMTWQADAVKAVVGSAKLGAGERFLRGLLEWCLAWDPPAGTARFFVDGLIEQLLSLSDADVDELERHDGGFGAVIRLGDSRPAYQTKLQAATRWLARVRWWRLLFPSSFERDDHTRLYEALRWFEGRTRGYALLRVTVGELVAAFDHGLVDSDELIDLLVGPRSIHRGGSMLRDVSTRKPPGALAERPALLAAVDRCRRRIVEIESARGDRPTAATPYARALRATGGLDSLARALGAMGSSHFSRTFSWRESEVARSESLSHIVVRSSPSGDDTPEAFAEWARTARVRESRLVELALYAPQWAAHVARAVGWPGFESAVWWFVAHTKDDRTWQLNEMKEIWAAEVSERTPLSADDLTDGAVDVAWFHDAYRELGAERWAQLDKTAKFAASSAGHTRAQLFGRAMGGAVGVQELIDRIATKRHQDSVRALGLVPLAGGERRRADVLERYTELERFRRASRKFGSLRQTNEKRAVAIAMENLARTAGYRDPQRLRWAMEEEAVADLVRGPVRLEKGDVVIELGLDETGTPQLRTSRKGKALKSPPAALSKDPDVAELKERAQALRRLVPRAREALEEAMCRGDAFPADELRALCLHPMLGPALGSLVFIGDGIIGYPREAGRVLVDCDATVHAVGSSDELRIAHPHDLLASGRWHAWQRECFATERVQPFKQVFRELYPITADERGRTASRRYAGHQVNPRQALGLLGGRGWTARPEEGVTKTFHEAGVTVRVAFEEPFFTPADIEGLTLDAVQFTKKGDWTAIPLADVGERVFSETMRDLDLVVSVAHQGGVDPEASASTIEMRASIVAETAALLSLPNVSVNAHHAFIQGALASYSVHLGSGGVLVLPGTALPIVAVHSQHRGRLFLPFANDDPRSAEVLSKVLLFARDREIKDPTILDWIRLAGGSGG